MINSIPIDTCYVIGYNKSMIKSFKHKGLKEFFETGNVKGIQAMHKNKINRILFALNDTTCINDLNLPGYNLHSLKGDLKGLWSITVQANWRITFKYDEFTNDVYIVDYQDYH